MLKLFTKHPHSIGETYFQHLKYACSRSIRLQIITLILFFHGLFPFLFEHAARDRVEKLFNELLTRNPKK